MFVWSLATGDIFRNKAKIGVPTAGLLVASSGILLGLHIVKGDPSHLVFYSWLGPVILALAGLSVIIRSFQNGPTNTP